MNPWLGCFQSATNDGGVCCSKQDRGGRTPRTDGAGGLSNVTRASLINISGNMGKLSWWRLVRNPKNEKGKLNMDHSFICDPVLGTRRYEKTAEARERLVGGLLNGRYRYLWCVVWAYVRRACIVLDALHSGDTIGNGESRIN